jgi:hypothetical protein
MHRIFKKRSSAFAATLLLALAACGGSGGGGAPEAGGAPVPDTTAPTVSAAAVVGSRAVVLSATVSDNVAVTKVDFLVDGGATRATAGDSQGRSVYSVSIPIERLSAGTHTLIARAEDAAGNATDAGAVNFSVGGLAGPSSPIKITASGVKAGGSVTFTVDIESDKQIKLTNFFIDGAFVGGRGDDQRHYSFSRSLSAGTHRLLVDVTDVNGQSAQAEVAIDA